VNIHLPHYSTDAQMTPDLWQTVQYFNLDENWGNPYKMNVHLIFYIDLLRKLCNTAIGVHNAHETIGHSPTGQHPKGRAIDCYARRMLLIDFFLMAMRLPFTGVGIYRWWTTEGLHLDRKPLLDDQPRRVWYRDQHGIYHNIITYSDLMSCFGEKKVS